MTPTQLRDVQDRLEIFLDFCFRELGRLERRQALSSYLAGLMLDGERKSMVPIASRLCENPDEVEAIRQRLQQAVNVAKWEQDELFRRISRRAESDLPEIEAMVIDDTGFPKKGKHSVGVQRQYSGTLGRTDNCQVATSLHLASEYGGVCIGMRLYLPETWAKDAERREKAGVPEEIVFKKKWEIALDLIETALGWETPRRPVLADSGYGDCIEFRQQLEDWDLEYVLGVSGTAVVWPPGQMPTPPLPKQKGELSRPRTKWTDGDARAMTMKELALSLPEDMWQEVSWGEGSRGKQSSRFVALRIRIAHNHAKGAPPGEEQWMLAEWPDDEDEPTKFWLSNMSGEITLPRLVYLAKLRWRIERDYQEMKGELGLDHYEGRRWLGFHHHVACVAAAHAFLTLERVLFPPQQKETDDPEIPSGVAASTPVHDRSLPDVR
jgi:SRSO17 transposase